MYKKEKGQFFTEGNPFILDPFREWFKLLPKNAKLLEPFAGSNNLIKMIDNIFGYHEWGSFDIEPPEKNNFPDVKTVRLDTVKDMPGGYDAIITNPPYLARNSATRSGIKFASENKYDDLYKFCLEKMLEKYDYVAAIIPESFITSGQFREKLYAVISLTQAMFKDTDCPVCVAMFVPVVLKRKKMREDDFLVYQLNDRLGYFSELNRDRGLTANCFLTMKFNDKKGEIGLRGVDNTRTNSIEFVRGETINPERVKNTSRAVTRISIDVDLSKNELDQVIEIANQILKDYRLATKDVFMTSFKGMRADGKYRRRLDYGEAKKILTMAVIKVKNDLGKEKFDEYSGLPLFSRYATLN